MRLFVAISLPEEVRDRLANLANGLPGARWVTAENLHLTLRFIGEVDNSQAEDVDAALTGLRSERLQIQIDGLGHFGEGKKIRALWAGLVPNPDLNRLQSKIEQALQRAGLPAETRKYKPHVTLARFKSSPGAKLQEYMAAHGGFRSAPIDVDAFELYSSFRAHSGAIYRAEATYPLERSALDMG